MTTDKALFERPLPSWVAQSTAIFLAGWLAFSGGLLCLRVSLLAIQPLRSVPIVLLSIALTAAAWLIRRLSLCDAAFFRRAKDKTGGLRTVVRPGVIASVGLLLWALALTLAARSAMAIGICWLLLLVEEIWAWHEQPLFFRRPPVDHPLRSHAAQEGRVIQQFTRLSVPDGEEIIRGTIAVQIESGGRTGAGHIAFCPPFSARPQFEVQFAERTDATLKVSQLFPHGARVEVRLPQAAQADRAVVVRFLGRCSRP